jgi:signal transduction histidine kinase
MTALAAVGRFVLRPLRLSTWRELAYLLLGFAMSILVFVVLVTLLSLGLSLLIIFVGLPILLATAYVNRWLADLERSRAGFLLREPIGRRYRALERPGFWHRVRVVSTDPQTWKDFGWLVLVTIVGFAFGLAAIVLWPVALSALSVPLWWWIPAHGSVLQINDSDPSSWSVDSWPRAFLVGGLGLVATVFTAWICAGLARGQVYLAKLLLSPSLDERVEELERTRAGAVAAQQDELERIERDLHDGAQARLVALALDLGLAREKLEQDPAAAAALVESAHAEAKTALVELRELVRGVHPVVLTDRGLDAAISALAARSPVPVSLDVHPGARLSRELEAAAYFVVAESLANVAKHADAEHAWVRIARRGGRLEVEVRDDGRGGAEVGAGSGIAGLARRVEALDGQLELESPPGRGTVVHVEIPCAS